MNAALEAERCPVASVIDGGLDRRAGLHGDCAGGAWRFSMAPAGRLDGNRGGKQQLQERKL